MPPNLLDLYDPRTQDASISGAKAANLARAAAAGMDVLPGFVLTTAAASAGVDDPGVMGDLRIAWRKLTDDHQHAVVVRSSSTIEDAGTSSMAGQFTSVLDVTSWTQFEQAVRRVLASAHEVPDGGGEPQPMAVLVQRQLDSPAGGVLFSIDPVTGDAEHLMVEVVPARPDLLVGGSVTAAHYVISRRGRVIERAHEDAARPLSRRDRRALVALARRAERAFVGPQDIEWAFDAAGKLWLLQTRPVTARADPVRKGCLMGPGPVAETFPLPLHRLEADLFVGPLRTGIVRALTATAAVSRRRIDESPVVTTVSGWVAADLELFGIRGARSRLRRRVDPSVVMRRLVAAWRVGRLRVALPQLAESVVATVDRDLSRIGWLDRYSDNELVDLIDRGIAELATLHTFEVLAGMLLPNDTHSVSAALIALQELEKGRAEMLTDAEIVFRSPVVLALIPPSIAPSVDLPPVAKKLSAEVGGVECLSIRDALRLRSRWLQELIVRIVRCLGQRFAAEHGWSTAELIQDMSWNEVVVTVREKRPPVDLLTRSCGGVAPPLPNAFRLTTGGAMVRANAHDESSVIGVAAGGGRGVGLVRHRVGVDSTGSGIVLVTRHLEPQLAPLLPSLDGLVSETGSALSHLAILAREMNVPTVAGVDGAMSRFPLGTRVVVDGDMGEIRVLADAPSSLGLKEGDQ